MDDLTKTLLETTQDLPRKILRKAILRKVRESNVPLPDEMAEPLLNHILAGNSESFVWHSDIEGDDINVKLNFTDEDVREIEEQVAKAIKAIPEAVNGGLTAAADMFFKTLCKRWKDEHLMQKYEIADFQEGLEWRWGRGLMLLRMLLTSCRELGQETFARHAKSKSTRYKFRRWVMLRLHTRACQVMGEIICLLENGFADGAMARWRTLYELSVVAILIADGDEILAERYIFHDAIEVKRQADVFDEQQAALGLPGIARRVRAEIDREHAKALARFGSEFAHPYGWAAQHLKRKKPTFKDLQEEADRAAMSTYYKLASFNVHASARSLFFNLSSIGPQTVLIAGRSNVGLDEAGSRAAHTIVLITLLYVQRPTNATNLFKGKVLLKLRDEAEKAFERAQRKLSREVQQMSEADKPGIARKVRESRKAKAPRHM